MATVNSSCELVRNETEDPLLGNASNASDYEANGKGAAVSGGNAIHDYLYIANIVIGLIGIIGNGVSCVVILSHRPLRIRLANYFLINQCFIDLLISMLLLISTAASLDYLQFTSSAGTAYCYLWKSRLFVLGFLVSSNLSIVAVSVERYIEIVHPIRHRISINQKIVVGCLVFTWIVGILFKMSNLLPFAQFNNGVCILGLFPNRSVSIFIVLYNFVGEFFGPLCIISFCYIQMWRTLQSKSISPMPLPSATSNSNSTTSIVVRARRNIVKTLSTVVVCFVATWTFKQLLSLVNGLGLASIDWNGTAYKISIILQFSNCCMNPFIYLFQYEEFQRGLLRFARWRQSPVAQITILSHGSAII